MGLVLHCWGVEGRIADIDLVAQTVAELKTLHGLDVEIVPDSSFYTARLPYLESPEGPISDICAIFDAILPMDDLKGKSRVEARAILNQNMLEMERTMLFVLYEELYPKTRRLHASLNPWPLAYYPPIWMRRYAKHRCAELAIPQSPTEEVPIVHDIQKREQERLERLNDAQKTLRADALLAQTPPTEAARLLRDCIERYRRL